MAFQPPSGFRERLLPTSPDVVPDEYVDSLRSFCEEAETVAAGYVCAVERLREGAEPETALRFCMKLTTPVDSPGDSPDQARALAMRLHELHPELMRELGSGVMADRAVRAWEKYGLRVIPAEPTRLEQRSEPGRG